MAWLGIVLLFLSPAFSADATTTVAKTDNGVIAVDARTGRVVWRHTPKTLNYAHFELYKRHLIVFPHYSGAKRTGAFALNPATGKPVRTAATARRPLARSEAFWPLGQLQLANGWQLTGINPGNTKSMRFIDPATKRVMGVLNTGIYYDEVEVYRNLVIYADSYLAKDNKILAYDAKRAKQVWSVDLTGWIVERDEWSRRKKLQVIGDKLYIQARQHVFAVDAKRGRVLWHIDLAADLRLSFHGDIVIKGGYALAVFARTGNTLIISYNGRVVAYDLKHHRYLWHIRPDTRSTPFPVAYNGRVYLTAGKNAKVVRVTRLPKKTP